MDKQFRRIEGKSAPTGLRRGEEGINFFPFQSSVRKEGKAAIVTLICDTTTFKAIKDVLDRTTKTELIVQDKRGPFIRRVYKEV